MAHSARQDAKARAARKKRAKFCTSRRRALLAKVHIAKKQLGLPDDAYRTVIASNFPGKESAKKLTDRELRSLIEHFKTRGWNDQGRGKRKPGSDYRTESKRPMVRKIYVLWAILRDNGRVSAKRPDGFVARQTKTADRPDGVANTEWLEDDEAWQVIEALKKWIHRENLEHHLLG